MSVSRRAFMLVTLFAAPLLCRAAEDGKGRTSVSKPIGYADPVTEFAVLRLTDPAVTSILPPSSGRPVAKRGNYLLFSSDASGRMEVYRLDYNNGEARQLSDAANLDPHSVNLLADERNFAYLDGEKLVVSGISSMRTRDVYKVAAGYSFTGGLAFAEDGLYATLIERKDAHYRLRLVRMLDGIAITLAEADEPFADPMPRPKRASVLYRRARGLWLVNYDAKQNYKLRTAEGEIKSATWSPDGRSLEYLIQPAEPGKLNSMREHTPDTNEDRLIASTSQFVAFARNADASVFVGASGSKASPYVLLLVGAVRRELTLAEHRANDPSTVTPLFAPNSRKIFFNSDRHGKLAIYSMQVEKLVEETDDAPEPPPSASKDGKSAPRRP